MTPPSNVQSAIAQKFFTANGMTPEEAWEKVKEWHLAGKTAEARRGAEILVEYFPEHPAKSFLAELPVDAKIASTSAKLGKGFSDIMSGIFQKKKKKPALGTVKSTPPETPAPETTAAPTVETPEEQPVTPVLDDERLFATISYAWIFCIIPLFMKRDSAFVQFHAKQGVIMAIALTVFDFTVGTLLNLISAGLGLLLKLIYIAFLAYAAYQAYQGKTWKIPFVYPLSQKLKF